MLNLSPSDLEELKNLHKKEKNKRRADRIKVLVKKKYQSYYYLDEDTITTWKNKFQNRTDSNACFDTPWIEPKMFVITTLTKEGKVNRKIS